MNSIGALVLFVSVGLLLFVGINALDDLHSEVNTTNDSELAAQNQTAQAVENPIFMAIGYILLIIAAVSLVNAFRKL